MIMEKIFDLLLMFIGLFFIGFILLPGMIGACTEQFYKSKNKQRIAFIKEIKKGNEEEVFNG